VSEFLTISPRPPAHVAVQSHGLDGERLNRKKGDLEAWRQLFARELRFQRTLPQFFGYYLIGSYFNLLLPTSVGGDVMRAWYLDGGSGRKLASLAAVLLDRINGLIVLIAMACLAVVLSPLPLPTWITFSVWGIGAAAALVCSVPICI